MNLVIGYLVGSISVGIAVVVMNHNLAEQKRAYERVLDEKNDRVCELSNIESFRRGRDAEANEQKGYQLELMRENERLRADNDELRHQLNLECVFDHKMKTIGRATLQVR